MIEIIQLSQLFYLCWLYCSLTERRYHQLSRTCCSLIMTSRTLILLALICCVSAASELEQSREGKSGPVERLLGGVAANVVVGVVRAVGEIARMVSALSSAVEILMSVILKNVIETTIPSQVFNLLQIGIYLI